MASTFSVVVDEMYAISREYGLDKIFDVSLADMKKRLASIDTQGGKTRPTSLIKS